MSASRWDRAQRASAARTARAKTAGAAAWLSTRAFAARTASTCRGHSGLRKCCCSTPALRASSSFTKACSTKSSRCAGARGVGLPPGSSLAASTCQPRLFVGPQVWDRNLPEGKERLVADAATVHKLLKILPESDPIIKGRAYRSCAVVGSAGSLLLHKLGPKIDAHALVIRFNNAPTKDFEAYVGSKTSLRITSDAFWGFQETSSEVVLVHSQSVDALRVRALSAGHSRLGSVGAEGGQRRRRRRGVL